MGKIIHTHAYTHTHGGGLYGNTDHAYINELKSWINSALRQSNSRVHPRKFTQS